MTLRDRFKSGLRSQSSSRISTLRGTRCGCARSRSRRARHSSSPRRTARSSVQRAHRPGLVVLMATVMTTSRRRSRRTRNRRQCATLTSASDGCATWPSRGYVVFGRQRLDDALVERTGWEAALPVREPREQGLRTMRWQWMRIHRSNDGWVHQWATVDSTRSHLERAGHARVLILGAMLHVWRPARELLQPSTTARSSRAPGYAEVVEKNAHTLVRTSRQRAPKAETSNATRVALRYKSRSRLRQTRGTRCWKTEYPLTTRVGTTR